MTHASRGPTTSGASGPAPPRPQRLAHPFRIVGFVSVSTAVLVAAFGLGYSISSSDEAVLDAVELTTPAIVRVEERVVDDGFSIAASMVPGSTADVFVTGPSVEQPKVAPSDESSPTGSDSSENDSQAVRAVVSASGDTEHGTVTYGSLLAEVSGRPVFASPGYLPLYRNLEFGDVGSDVRLLQRFLDELGLYDGEHTGVLGERTLSSLTRLYENRGYELPYVSTGAQGFAWREFVALPAADLAVVRTAPVGTVLSAEVALVTVQTSAPSLGATFDVSERDRLPAGSPIGLSIDGGATHPTSVVAIGAFSTDESTGLSGFAASVALPAGVAVDAASVLRLVPIETPPTTIAVPVTAIRQGPDGVFVVKAPARSETTSPAPPGEEIQVTVRDQAAGWVSIEPHDALPVGTRLLAEP